MKKFIYSLLSTAIILTQLPLGSIQAETVEQQLSEVVSDDNSQNDVLIEEVEAEENISDDNSQNDVLIEEVGVEENISEIETSEIDDFEKVEQEVVNEKKEDNEHILSRASYNLALNTTVEGKITTSNTYNLYKIVVPKAGRVYIKLENYIDRLNFYFLDDNNNNIINYGSLYTYATGSSETPGKYSWSVDLEPGTYYIKMEQRNGTGKYQLKTGFTAANNNEKEPNNGTTTAHKLSASNGNLKGFISWNDSVDYYKITTSEAGRVYIELENYIDKANFYFLDDNNNNIINYGSLYTYVTGSSETPGKYSWSVDLEPGTYYIKMEQRNGTGKYQLKTGFTAANNNEKEWNNGTATAQKVDRNFDINGFISWNDSVDVYRFNINKTMIASINLESFIGQVRFILLDSNYNEIKNNRYIYGSSTNPGKYNETFNLSAGTYYIKIEKYDSNTGKYKLNVSTTAFSDMLGHWSLPYVEKFVDSKKIDGYSDGTFRPNATITRAEFVKIVNNAFGLKDKAKTNFKDVKGWKAEAAAIGVKAGYITNGTAFRPDDSITREEAAKIIGIVAGIKGDGKLTFNDKNQISSWAKVYVDGLAEANIVSNKGNFRPKDNLRRGEAVKMLQQTIENK